MTLIPVKKHLVVHPPKLRETMKKTIHLLLFCLGCVPILSYAQMINLVCVGKADNYTFSISFDEKNQLVLIETLSVPAAITDRQIIFKATIGSQNNKDAYTFRLSRDTGTMMIQETSGLVFGPYECSTARQRF